MNDGSSEQPVTALIVGTSVDVDGFRLTPEVLTLEGDARVRLSAPGQEDFLIPAEYLVALSSRGGGLHSGLLRTLDDTRRSFVDVSSFGLQSFSNHRWVPQGTNPEDDMTPVLQWVTPRDFEAENSGWRIYLAGAKESPVGFARWDDRAAVENLVAMMDDPDSMLTIAAIMNPGPVAKLTGRLAAATMRSARQLPGIDLKKIRAILAEANVSASLGEDAANRWTAARLRLLTVVSGTKAVPVAVAIQPPYTGGRDILTEAERQLSYPERNELMEQRRLALVEPWLAKTRQALIAGGWRLVDLPNPRAMWGRSGEVIWTTRIDPETWSGIAAAAAGRAEQMEMSRGAVL